MQGENLSRHQLASVACVVGRDAQGDWKGRVRVEVSVMLHQQTPQLEAFARSLPEWTTLALSTTFQRGFDF